MSTVATTSRADELAAIDADARKCVRALRVDDVRYDRGQAALAAMSNGAVYAPPLDDPSEPVRMRLIIDDVVCVEDGESPRQALLAWFCERVSELGKGV